MKVALGSNPTMMMEMVDAARTAVVEIDAGPVVEVAEADAGTELVNVVPKGKRDPVPAPTAKQLKDRIARLAARAKKKQDLDPTALQFLGRYRIEAAAADSVQRRSKLDKALSDWERNFLKK